MLKLSVSEPQLSASVRWRQGPPVVHPGMVPTGVVLLAGAVLSDKTHPQDKLPLALTPFLEVQPHPQAHQKTPLRQKGPTLALAPMPCRASLRPTLTRESPMRLAGLT